MKVFWPYRWKSVIVAFTDGNLDETVLSGRNRELFKGRQFGGKTVIQAGRYAPFGRKLADSLAVKLIDGNGAITIEPCEQVFFTEYINGNDPRALLLIWLSQNFGDVTLDEDTETRAAAECEPQEPSVTNRTCEICGTDISNKRAGAVTCSTAHRKALSRLSLRASKTTLSMF